MLRVMQDFMSKSQGSLFHCLLVFMYINIHMHARFRMQGLGGFGFASSCVGIGSRGTVSQKVKLQTGTRIDTEMEIGIIQGV